MKNWIAIALMGILPLQVGAAGFVQIKNGQFVRDEKPYFFMGTNFWQGMNLGSRAVGGNRAQLIRELDLMKKTGITQLRVLALSEGPNTAPYRIVPAVQIRPGQVNETVLEGLDFLLDELKKRDMTAVMVLGNFWPWSGGFAQWVSWIEKSSIPYPPPHPGGSWNVFQDYSSRFYTLPEAVSLQQEAVKKIITRVNSISGLAYAQDPSILSWELANEPRGGKYRKEFLAWIQSSVRLIRALDGNHLITLGSEGETLDPAQAGNDFVEDHSVQGIDYATIHIWVENWGAYNPKESSTFSTAMKTMKDYIATHVAKTKLLGKPLILEEFGMARDGRSMDPASATTSRDLYYSSVFDEVLNRMKLGEPLYGVNFWAWSGESRPVFPFGGLWKKGDPMLGDPPHEEQGWYGVYSSDESTLKVISGFSRRIQSAVKARSKQ